MNYSDGHYGKIQTLDHEMSTSPGPHNTFSVGFFSKLYKYLFNVNNVSAPWTSQSLTEYLQIWYKKYFSIFYSLDKFVGLKNLIIFNPFRGHLLPSGGGEISRRVCKLRALNFWYLKPSRVLLRKFVVISFNIVQRITISLTRSIIRVYLPYQPRTTN